jgi:hypothetical protein
MRIRWNWALIDRWVVYGITLFASLNILVAYLVIERTKNVVSINSEAMYFVGSRLESLEEEVQQLRPQLGYQFELVEGDRLQCVLLSSSQ